MSKKTDKATKAKPYRWSWEEYLSGEEFLERIWPELDDARRSMQEMNGDMFMSDYRKLMDALEKMYWAVGRKDDE